MSTLKSDCRKFSPNVFNKSKCQNCFRTKDSHSAEALENNRASRNVSKCGYLFVAPDWDFNVSINRTKRWQRRWFVLFDDGELTYALDEFPDTIPQGTIDMNKVLDVSDAEKVTGNDFAIAITTPEKVHFIKGTSKEESKWWFDVLSKVLPRHLSRAKHKRNATFPCGKATIPTTAAIAQEFCSEDDMRLNSYDKPIRPKFLSTSELTGHEKNWVPSPDAEEDDVFPPIENNELNSDPTKKEVELQNALNKLISRSDEEQEESDGQTNHQEEKMPKDYLSQLEELDSRRRNRRYLKRENRIQRSQRSRVDGVSKMLPGKTRSDKNAESSAPPPSSNGSAMAAAEKLEYLESINSSDVRHSSARSQPSEQGKKISIESPKCSTEARDTSLKTNLRKSESLKNIPSETQSEMQDHVSGLRRYHSFKSSSTHRKVKPINGTSSLKKSKLSRSATSTPISTAPIRQASPAAKISFDANKSPSPDICYEHSNDGVFTRTGWLMRQTLSKDWSKHWFVLKDSSLTYYRDPSAEHCGIMDGILDLNQVSTIRETSSDRYYAFSLLMWDGKKHILAAETDDFRNMWVQALQYASNLWSSASKEDFICSEIVLPEHTFHHSDRSVDRVSPPSSLSSLAYVYDNNLLETSTSSSDDQSEYFSLVDEDEVSELSSSPRTLPPSPPVNRNMMSLVKEKSRTRCNAIPKTPISASGLDFPVEDNDHNADRDDERYQNDSKSIEYKDTTTRSRPQEENIHQLLNGEINSSTIANSSTSSQFTKDGEISQFRNDSSKNYKDAREDFRTPVKTIRSEHSSTSTPEPESMDECRMCVSMKNKLVAAKEEIKKLKKELKEAHASFDNLEMASYKLAQDIKVKEENYSSQISLMTAKIDDLTSKFSIAEKNYRQLKQKTLKSEGKERKRSSLKNREGLTLTKEYEQKLCELEKKIGHIEVSLLNESTENSEHTVPHSKTEENGILPSESSDTSTSTELSSSSSKGFFSRLQSLGSKVQSVDALLEKDSLVDDSENPKICVQVRDCEVSTTIDQPDDWWTTSFNNSIKNLNKYIDDHPSNLSECQNVLIKKVSKIIAWLKNSLECICKKDGDNCDLVDDKIHLLQNLLGLLNPLSSVMPKESVNIYQSNACHNMWTVFEVMKVLGKIDSVDDIDTLVKYDQTECAFKVIIKTLCIALAEYENLKLTDLLQLISEIPNVRFFCPLINKLFPQTQDDLQQFSTVSELLRQLNSQRSAIFSALQEAKDIRYDSLWNTLTDIPVQDANTNKPRPINSILNYTTSVAANIYQIAELQLASLQYQTPYILITEQKKVRKWCSETCIALKESLTIFLDELKEQCPMIHESTVSLSDLSVTIRQEITSCISELSFLSLTSSVLNSLLEPFKNHQNGHQIKVTSEELMDQVNQFSVSKSVYLPRTDIFECPQCTILNSFMSDASSELNWSDYVRNYNQHKPSKSDKFDYRMDDSKSNLSNVCSNCDNKLSEPDTGNISEVCNGRPCSECDEWIKKFCASERQHELERQAIELKHNEELQQLEECLIKSSEVHEQEMLQKENELAITTTQLQCLKTEYETQVHTLKNLYEQKLHFDCTNIDEDNIRQTYKAEIEDLKDMFKKGLLAIENSHHRITNEMEKRHKDEIIALKAEKDRALELEAQATKTALEVIQKSHDEKLLEETALIKQDLMKQFQSTEQCKDFFCKYGNDLEKLKSEILTITELYSTKCLENVALEEKVNSLRRQLEDAHTELCDFLTKNKQIELNSSNI